MSKPAQLVLIDESGDAGFKLGKGSSRFFVICAIVFNNYQEAERVSLAITNLKSKTQGLNNIEFKFNKTDQKNRIKFLKAINNFNFAIQYLAIDKTAITNNRSIGSETIDIRKFYIHAVENLLKKVKNQISNALIKIDGRGDRLFIKSLSVFLRKNINVKNKKIISNFKFVNSKTDVLIQMADMVAGSIRRYYEGNKSDSKIYRNIFLKHIKDKSDSV